MKRLIVAVLVLTALGLAASLGGATGKLHVAQKAQAGRLGIDDEMTDEQERIISGYAAFELGMTGNDNPSANNSPTRTSRGAAAIVRTTSRRTSRSTRTAST